jgi:anti-sigma regulatory factor (Ser/Thr protein kinase)
MEMSGRAPKALDLGEADVFCSVLNCELGLPRPPTRAAANAWNGRPSPVSRETPMITQAQTPSLPMAVAAEQTSLQIPSQPEWIAPAVEYLKDKALLCGACHESQAHKLTLVLHEALTNSVIHGNLELSSELKERGDNAFTEALAQRAADPRYAERTVTVRVDYNGERCRWTITDQGKGFDVERALTQASSDDPEVLLSSGRGLLLMRAFLDDLTYELGGRRAILTLAHPSGEEKRRTPRLPLQRPIHVAPLAADGSVDWDGAHEAVARNLSADGIAVLQSRLAASERILVGIDWHGQMLYLPAEVRHCQARGDDMVELGCRFQISPDGVEENAPPSSDLEAAIDALLGQLNPRDVPSHERRLHPRAAYTERLHIDVASNGASAVGFGRDLSKGGISFLTSTPLPLENATLTLPQRGGDGVRVLARIVRCHQLLSGVYDVGARFVAVAE